MKRLAITFLVALLAAPLCNAEPRYATESPPILHTRIDAGKAQLVDVREPVEWSAGHVSEATLAPLSALKANLTTAAAHSGLRKDRPLYLYCRSGHRAMTAAVLLEKSGYDVHPLKAGYLDLIKQGYSSTTGPAK